MEHDWVGDDGPWRTSSDNDVSEARGWAPEVCNCSGSSTADTTLEQVAESIAVIEWRELMTLLAAKRDLKDVLVELHRRVA